MPVKLRFESKGHTKNCRAVEESGRPRLAHNQEIIGSNPVCATNLPLPSLLQGQWMGPTGGPNTDCKSDPAERSPQGASSVMLDKPSEVFRYCLSSQREIRWLGGNVTELGVR